MRLIVKTEEHHQQFTKTRNRVIVVVKQKVLNVKIRLQVFEELGGDHDTDDEKPMDVNRCDADLWMELNEMVDVRIGYHEDKRAEIEVLENPLQIPLYAHVQHSQTFEHTVLGRPRAGVV